MEQGKNEQPNTNIDQNSDDILDLNSMIEESGDSEVQKVQREATIDMLQKRFKAEQLTADQKAEILRESQEYAEKNKDQLSPAAYIFLSQSAENETEKQTMTQQAESQFIKDFGLESIEPAALEQQVQNKLQKYEKQLIYQTGDSNKAITTIAESFQNLLEEKQNPNPNTPPEDPEKSKQNRIALINSLKSESQCMADKTKAEFLKMQLEFAKKQPIDTKDTEKLVDKIAQIAILEMVVKDLERQLKEEEGNDNNMTGGSANIADKSTNKEAISKIAIKSSVLNAMAVGGFLAGKLAGWLWRQYLKCTSLDTIEAITKTRLPGWLKKLLQDDNKDEVKK